MVKIVTFASERFYRAMAMLTIEAEQSGFFNAVRNYTDKGLTRPMQDYARANPRGYGYWRWKPMVCWDTASQCKRGDIMVYADAGCVINKTGDMGRWIDMAGDGILSFQMEAQLSERRYTKAQTMDYFAPHGLKDTAQLVGGCFLMRINDHNMDILDEWFQLSHQPSLFDDTVSENEDAEFIDHRHDQSVFSLLRKIRGASIVPDETYHDGNGNYDPKAPIWTARRR